MRARAVPLLPMFDYTIPVLHPLAVHFPVALLMAAAPVAVVWAWRRTAFWRGALAALLVLGALGAGAAYATGGAMAEQSEGVPIVDLFVAQHARLGAWTLGVSLAAALAVLTLAAWEARGLRLPTPLRWAAVGLALAAALLAAWTGHLGGLMVWGVPV